MGAGGGEVQHRVDDSGVAELVFANAPRRNALSRGMLEATARLLSRWEDNPRVRAVIVTGQQGGKAFSSGLDLSEEVGGSPAALTKDLDAYWSAWQRFSKPVLAMIDGYCVGGGLITALHADIRYCSEGSSFSIPAVRLGMSVSASSAAPLVDAVGPSWASEMLYAGRQLSAHEARQAGLVSRVFGVGELDDATRLLAREIAEMRPDAVRAAKIAVREVKATRLASG